MFDLWLDLVSTINPDNEAMPAVLQSTISLLELELGKARAALQQLQPPTPFLSIGDEVSVGAMAAYRQNLINRAPDFYGSRRLTAKELGLEPIVCELPQETITSPLSLETAPVMKRAPIERALSNSLILDHVAPYLSIPSLMALSSTSHLMHSMVTRTPYIFRHVDLSNCKGAQLPTTPQSQDNTQTEDQVYSAPLRHIFNSLEKRSVLQDVRTLVLDGLPVPTDLVSDIILSDRFNVNILSIRECQHLNERKLMQLIQYAVRPTRPEGTPRVKGIYHFSPRVKTPRTPVRRRVHDWWGSRNGRSQASSASSSIASSDNEDDGVSTIPRPQQNEWYSPSGKLFKHSLEDGWAETLQKCEGIIAFDAVLCRGPRHDVNFYSSVDENSVSPEAPLLAPAIATVALGPRGCDGCHSSPEGPAIWGQSPDHQFPLLDPVPLHVSIVAAAKCPEQIPGKHPLLIARCTDCLTDRWCHRCNKWFCSSCLPNPKHVQMNLSPHQTAVRPPPGQSTGSSRRRQVCRIPPDPGVQWVANKNFRILNQA
ncbi:hypothetical protein N7488_007852 [Penicillium malachiteum]|nr:hypothetical protein N7488_007852 [Penicillium malachiteum]